MSERQYFLTAHGLDDFKITDSVFRRRADWKESHEGRNIWGTNTHRPSMQPGDVLIGYAKGTGKFYAADLVKEPPSESNDPAWKYEVLCEAEPLVMISLGAAPEVSVLGVKGVTRTYRKLTREQGELAMQLLEERKAAVQRAREQLPLGRGTE